MQKVNRKFFPFNLMNHSISAAVIISDCIDENARVRQQCRFASLFGVEPSYIGVCSAYPELEAAGHLIDVLDAHRMVTPASSVCSSPANYQNASCNDTSNLFTAVIIVNVAPRTESIKKRWGNGTPFCYLAISGVLIVSTFSNPILSLLISILEKEEKLPEVSIHLMDTCQVINHAASSKWIPEEDAQRIINTQFRSYEFVPLAAHWIVVRGGLSSLPHRLVTVDDLEKEKNSFIWFIDNFGNCKTSILPRDISFEEDKSYTVEFQCEPQSLEVVSCKRLSDSASGKPSIIIGSSGYKNNRFLELVIKNESFSSKMGVSIGHVSIKKLE